MMACVALLIAWPSFANASSTSCIQARITTATEARVLKLEVAVSAEERAQGLMHRTTIGPCDGMAFFFPTLKPQSFWMKNTHLPLDLLFIDASGRIVRIAQGVPMSLEPIRSGIATKSVIEIDAGRAAREGIAVGDTVQYEPHPSLVSPDS